MLKFIVINMGIFMHGCSSLVVSAVVRLWVWDQVLSRRASGIKQNSKSFMQVYYLWWLLRKGAAERNLLIQLPVFMHQCLFKTILLNFGFLKFKHVKPWRPLEKSRLNHDLFPFFPICFICWKILKRLYYLDICGLLV